MKKLLLAVLAIALLCPKGQAQTNSGQLIASQYGQWTVQGYAPNSYQFAPTSCRVQGGSSFFFAFAQGTPIKIVDGNPSMNEIVTPSNVIDSNVTCAVSIAPLNNHQLPFSLASATGGLQEALNANIASPQKNTIILDATWYQSVGASNAAAVIGAAKGSTQLGLVDQTQVPYVWYQWSGTQYTAVSLGGGCTGSQCVISLNSLQGAVGLQQGSNVTLTPSGQNIIISAQTGAGVPGGPWNSARYGSATGTGVPSPSQSLFQIDSTTSLSQMNALIASLNIGGGVPPFGGPYTGNGTILLPDGSNVVGFFNQTSTSGSGNLGVNVVDIRAGVHSTPLSTWGVAGGISAPGCARLAGNYTFTQGQTTVTPLGAPFLLGDVGGVIEVVGTVAGVPTRFMPTISSVNVSTGVATISTPAPFNASYGAIVGYLNTGNFQNAMTGLGTTLTGQIPSGCPILTDTIAWNNGQSLVGDSPATASIVDLAGDDGMQNPDGAGLGSVTKQGLVAGHFQIVHDTRIDATKVWADVNASGATTVHQPLYRPAGDHTAEANNPLAPGWAQGPGSYSGGAQNGVAAITSGNAVMCVPTSYFSRLTAGHQIVFRDTPTVFKSTISSLTGAGCASGFSGATMAAPAPATIAQAEWVDTTSIQSLSVAMAAGAITYPKTITVANATTPTPGFESNVAGHGHIKIGNEEYDYIGGNNSIASAGPYTFLLQNGPATTAGWAIGTPVVPMNPCAARYETPWPVVPTINTGDSTPSGATFFPAYCIGSAAISMPQANANTYAGTGFADAYLQDIIVSTYGGPVNQNSAACYYMAGNTASYETSYDGMQCVGTQYGIVQGPASSGNHGFALVGPTGQRNHYRDLVLRNAINLIFDDMQVSSLEGVSAYTTGYNPYDGTAIGDMTFEIMGNTYDEQNGNLVSNTAFVKLEGHNSEPENGSHIEVPVYSETDCNTCSIDTTAFEGALNYVGGAYNQMLGGQLSGAQALPVIDWGSHNVIEDTQGGSNGPVNNTFGSSSFLEWGSYARVGTYSADGLGPKAAGAIGTREEYDGDDSWSFVTGNFAKPYRNIKSGYILAEEFSTAGMPIGKTFDATELKQGAYTGCNISPTASCTAVEFNGFDGYLLIGNGDRFQPIKYNLYMNLKMSSGTAQPLITIAANSVPGATCTSPGTIATFGPNLTSTWTMQSTQIDLSSYAGCGLSFTLGPTFSGTGLLQVGAVQLLPTVQLTHGPIATYTAGAACPAGVLPGDELGIDASNQYFCGSSSTIIAQAISSSGGGINALTGDVTGSGTGSVATTVKSIGGGPAFTSQTAGPECNNGSSGQLIPCVNGAFSGAVSGASVTGGTVINGVYSVPSSASSVFNISIANSQNLVLGQNTTTTLSAGSAGGEFVSFTVSENATGGFTFAWPSNFVAFPAINTAANSKTTVLGYWDGTFVWSSGSMPNVFTTLGDTLYAGTSGAPTRLAGSTSTQPAFMSQTGNGTISAAPAWNTSTGAGAVVLANNPVMGDITVNSITTTGSGVPCMTLGTTGSLVTICSGAGAPATTCGTQPTGSGSLYMRNDGTASTSLYSCAVTTWTPVTVP